MHPISLAFSVMTSLLSRCPSGVSKKVGWPKCQDGVWILFITVSDKASRLITSFLWSQFKQLMCVSPQPFGFTVHCKMLLYISSIYWVDLLWKHVTIGWLNHDETFAPFHYTIYVITTRFLLAGSAFWPVVVYKQNQLCMWWNLVSCWILFSRGYF